MAKGYNQKEGIDYNETFAPVIKQQALKLFLAISVIEDAEEHHIDITTAFLNGEIDDYQFDNELIFKKLLFEAHIFPNIYHRLESFIF